MNTRKSLIAGINMALQNMEDKEYYLSYALTGYSTFSKDEAEKFINDLKHITASIEEEINHYEKN